MSFKHDESNWLGYRHPDYAFSFDAEGTVRNLEHSKGWVIERKTKTDNRFTDAMGLYPLFSCDDWQALPADLDKMRNDGLVSLVLVTAPHLDEEDSVFSLFDVVTPFKTHYLADLDQPVQKTASRHHAYYARRAAREVQVELVEQPARFLDDWYLLYADLVAKYQITDMRAFSRNAFARLLAMPGVFLFKAERKGELVGAQIILLQDNTAFAHLAAFTKQGYDLGASYLLDWHAIEFFRGRASFINWGGGRGFSDIKDDGLARYKQGWSTRQGTSYLLGAVFDRRANDILCKAAGIDPAVGYFPAYRHGEFNRGNE